MIFLNGFFLVVFLCLAFAEGGEAAHHYSDDEEEITFPLVCVSRPQMFVDTLAMNKLIQAVNAEPNSAVKAQLVVNFLKEAQPEGRFDMLAIRTQIQETRDEQLHYPDAQDYLPNILKGFGVSVQGAGSQLKKESIERRLEEPASSETRLQAVPYTRPQGVLSVRAKAGGYKTVYCADEEYPQHCLSQGDFHSLGAQLARKKASEDKATIFCVFLEKAFPQLAVEVRDIAVAFETGSSLQDILTSLEVRVGNPAALAFVPSQRHFQQPESSRLLHRDGEDDSDDEMPPQHLVGTLSQSQLLILKSKFDINNAYREQKVVQFLQEGFPQLTQSDLDVVHVSLRDPKASLEDLLITLKVGVESLSSPARASGRSKWSTAKRASSGPALWQENGLVRLSFEHGEHLKDLFQNKDAPSMLHFLKGASPTSSFEDDMIALALDLCPSFEGFLQNLNLTIAKDPRGASRQPSGHLWDQPMPTDGGDEDEQVDDMEGHWAFRQHDRAPMPYSDEDDLFARASRQQLYGCHQTEAQSDPSGKGSVGPKSQSSQLASQENFLEKSGEDSQSGSERNRGDRLFREGYRKPSHLSSVPPREPSQREPTLAEVSASLQPFVRLKFAPEGTLSSTDVDPRILRFEASDKRRQRHEAIPEESASSVASEGQPQRPALSKAATGAVKEKLAASSKPAEAARSNPRVPLTPTRLAQEETSPSKETPPVALKPSVRPVGGGEPSFNASTSRVSASNVGSVSTLSPLAGKGGSAAQSSVPSGLVNPSSRQGRPTSSSYKLAATTTQQQRPDDSSSGSLSDEDE